MNGPHDLGGQMGFGPVAPERDEPYFHAAWEKRALGVTLAAGAMGAWTLDESRHMRECLHPADYYSSSYYEIWIKALERLLARHGFVGAEDPLPYGNLPIGSRLRVLPNHACITAAAYDRYYVVDSDLDGGKSVVDVYDRINGW
ncbi:MAG: nitrile hydratase subunit beta [Rhizobiales bacterium]|nr:nitrile hydratase subunit beta [Hyphomicrobiales bacterium]